jgi:sialic acid synthase SpsE
MTLIIPEIGINHNGEYWKAVRMVDDAKRCGCEIVKFQCHIAEEEMTKEARQIIPANAHENIYDMMKRCSLTEEEERRIKEYVEYLGMTYLCTPFSRTAADRLESMGVTMYKIGSGECNNYPLLKHIAEFKKPVILSTGMNDFDSIDKAVEILGDNLYCILHCVSMYPTPYDKINLSAMFELKERYGKPVGLSDHSIGLYTAFAAIALGACVVEKHFASDKQWVGSDIPISIGVPELRDLCRGETAIRQAMAGCKTTHAGELPTIAFAFASVVALRDINPGETFTLGNTWVKRPGTGIKAEHLDTILGKLSACFIPKDSQLKWSDIV